MVQTWTMSSSCTSPMSCTGEVTKRPGLDRPDAARRRARQHRAHSAPSGSSTASVANWEPCPEGTSAPGTQKFVFWGWDPANSERNMKIVDLLVGSDTTKGPSGACGINKPLVIELPMRLEKVA